MGAKTKFTHEAAALTIFLETMGLYFRLRDTGKKSDLVTPDSSRIWGILHPLAVEGPQTVPQLARARPVSRQRIQQIANEAAVEGLIEFINNPAHKKSKLMQLTDLGRARHKQMVAQFAEVAGSLAEGMRTQDLEVTGRTLNHLRARLAAGKLPLGGLANTDS